VRGVVEAERVDAVLAHLQAERVRRLAACERRVPAPARAQAEDAAVLDLLELVAFHRVVERST
jgi:hypothetical protein